MPEGKTTREETIQQYVDGPKKILKEWAIEKGSAPFRIPKHLQQEGVTEWQAKAWMHILDGAPMLTDALDQEVEVELTIRAKVKVIGQMRFGVMDQNSWEVHDAFDDEKLAKAMVFASLNPVIASHHYAMLVHEDYWDGVGNMSGLVRELTLED